MVHDQGHSYYHMWTRRDMIGIEVLRIVLCVCGRATAELDHIRTKIPSAAHSPNARPIDAPGPRSPEHLGRVASGRSFDPVQNRGGERGGREGREGDGGGGGGGVPAAAHTC